PVKIIDLARNLIKLSGYTEEEIPIKCIGTRPGEKMYEELMSEQEILPGQVYEKIYVGKTVDTDEISLRGFLKQFDEFSNETLKDELIDRKSTRLNSSHVSISYA